MGHGRRFFWRVKSAVFEAQKYTDKIITEWNALTSRVEAFTEEVISVAEQSTKDSFVRLWSVRSTIRLTDDRIDNGGLIRDRPAYQEALARDVTERLPDAGVEVW